MNNTITIDHSKLFVEGPITLYKAINSMFQYAPIFAGDPSVQKQFSFGTFRFEHNNFGEVTISYASDLSPSFEGEVFEELGTGEWGNSNWGDINWGGVAASIPIRTFIPRQKQRCTFLIPKFEHRVAIQKYSLLYVSLVVRAYSNRSYNGDNYA